MEGQLLDVHSPEASTAHALGPITGSENIQESIRCPGQRPVVARTQPAAVLPLQPCCEKWPTCGPATRLAKPGRVGGLCPWAVQDPVTSGRGGDAPPQHWLCTPWSRNSPASTIPCTMQRCGGYRSPTQLCPPGSPGSSRRFPYPGLASTGHTSPAGRRGERVSAWLLAGAFRVRDGALPSKG